MTIFICICSLTLLNLYWGNIEYIKSIEQYKYALPVTGTNATILLMPFYNTDAYICQGRDIAENEYKNGDKVCLIPQEFAEDNNITLGDSIDLQLYFADYKVAAFEYFDFSSREGINAKGEVYSVFEDSDYTIVGFYEMAPGADTGSYGLAENEVIIPSKSIRNSDENNIVSYGPMKSSTTLFQIPNGSSEEFMKEWGKLGYDQLEINFYDRGYSKLKVGMDNMKNISLTLTIVGFVMVVYQRYIGISDVETNENVRDVKEDIQMVILISTLSMSLIVLLGVGISVYQMNRNLQYEPMELLCRQKE